MQYDADGNLTASIDADGDTTQYLYDAAGNQTAVIDPDGNTTTMAYDPAGNLTKTISPTGGTTLQSYDGDGNLTETIDPDGNTTVTSYDADDRETQQIWYNSSGTPIDTLAWTYDADGNMLSASNSNGTYTFAYDNDGRLTNVQEPFGVTLSYSYDGDGNQTQVVDSFGGTQTSIYDLADRLTTREYIGEGEELRIDFTYNAEGQIATQTDYSNLAGTDLVSVTDTEYDADGNVVDIHSYNSSDATIDHFAYTYNAAGNLVQEVDVQDGVTTTTCYDYDPAGQLIGAGSTTYSYDAAGNRDSTGDVVGAGNELTSDGTYNYTYDANGNETSKTDIATGDTWTYGYNNANEMVSAVEKNSSDVVEQSICYSYDVFGNLIGEEATVGCTTTITKFAVDGWNPAETGASGNSNFNVWAVLSCSGSLTSRYVWGDQVSQQLGRIDVGISTNTTYWALTDHLGSIRTVINNSGTVVDSIAYDAFGNITSETDPSERGLFGYTGSFTNNLTTFQLHNARWYDPDTGRWMQQDPIGFAAGDPDLYGYVGNNPTDATDPSGEILVAENRSGAAAMLAFLQGAGISTATYSQNGSGRYVFWANPGEVRDALNSGRTLGDLRPAVLALLPNNESYVVSLGYQPVGNSAGEERVLSAEPTGILNWSWISSAEQGLYDRMDDANRGRRPNPNNRSDSANRVTPPPAPPAPPVDSRPTQMTAPPPVPPTITAFPVDPGALATYTPPATQYQPPAPALVPQPVEGSAYDYYVQQRTPIIYGPVDQGAFTSPPSAYEQSIIDEQVRQVVYNTLYYHFWFEIFPSLLGGFAVPTMGGGCSQSSSGAARNTAWGAPTTSVGWAGTPGYGPLYSGVQNNQIFFNNTPLNPGRGGPGMGGGGLIGGAGAPGMGGGGLIGRAGAPGMGGGGPGIGGGPSFGAPGFVINNGLPPAMPNFAHPANNGRTAGLLIFRYNGQTCYVQLTSGVNNAAAAGLGGARYLPGATGQNYHHVEFQALEVMRQLGITNATLLHNYQLNNSLPCGYCMPGGNLSLLQSSLTNGGQLQIFGLVPLPSPPGSQRSPWMVAPAGSVTVNGTW